MAVPPEEADVHKAATVSTGTDTFDSGIPTGRDRHVSPSWCPIHKRQRHSMLVQAAFLNLFGAKDQFSYFSPVWPGM